MKYAIISDLHANLEALRAVLDDASSKVDAVVCLGDIVGYNADPHEVPAPGPRDPAPSSLPATTTRRRAECGVTTTSTIGRGKQWTGRGSDSAPRNWGI